MLLYSAVQSFDKRSDEAFASGKTQGFAIPAAVGDSFGGSPFIRGRSLGVTLSRRVLNSKERGARLGSRSAGLSLNLGRR